MYNFLRDAKSIKNSYLCRYDTLDAYSSDFHVNGLVDGWDVYNNIYLYGCWNSILFGSANDRSCYISRTNPFVPIEAESFYLIKIMMKITNQNPDKAVGGLTKGRVMWTTLTESDWDSSRQMDFDIIADDRWRLYVINLGPAQWWQGDVNNLRVYPFLDGWPNDQFAIKFIRVSSYNVYKCSNTQCSYYLNYSHPCPGAGNRGSCEAGVSKFKYTTVSGISDELVLDIDGYGPVRFNLGENYNVDGTTISRIIANKISLLSIGGYAYSECEHTAFNRLKITSGNVGAGSSVTISGTAAEALGFFSAGSDVSTKVVGSASATGFDYASSRLLTSHEINSLINGNVNDLAYVHNPIQYNLEGGRRDFFEVGNVKTAESSERSGMYYNNGSTLIDISHPINANGRLKSIYMYGDASRASKVKVFRPHSDGTLSVVYSQDLPTENVSYLYTASHLAYRVDCDILVNRGDLVGFYNADLAAGLTREGFPDATFHQVSGEMSARFTPGKPQALGIVGFAIYVRGDRYQSNVILDIDLGDRTNIEECTVYGSESEGSFEFNVASCLDVAWNVDLFGESHHHDGVNWLNGDLFHHTHMNAYYGKSCLDDCIRTADNGQIGTTHGKDAYGDLAPTGPDGSFAYFYVNGDAEWLYAFTNDGKHEYAWPYVPGSAWGPARTAAVGGFVTDPIAFSLIFPYQMDMYVHKTTIYFKERINFRNMALSYYLGEYDATGNADNPYFRLVPSYNSIALNGTVYRLTDGFVNKYLFANPMTEPIGTLTTEEELSTYAASQTTKWNTIEHTFNPIKCKGFRIFTNQHYSTKIMEMEVYSKLATTPSLLDNVFMRFSIDGEIWNEAVFNADGDTKVTAIVGGAPRYFNLEFDSATVFTIGELEFSVGDQVKLGDCSDTFLLNSAKRGGPGESTPLVLENVYGRDLDLIVDLPKEVSNSEEVIFWSKLHSQEDLDKPQIGPPCRLYKSPDLDLGHYYHQCAINDPAYGLKNLIHNKQAYYNYYEDDWLDFGTLISGTSLDYCNTDRINVKKSEFTFDASSSTYWKFVPSQMTTNGAIKDVIAYYNDERVDIEEVYLASDPGMYTQVSGISSDGIGLPDYKRTFVYDDFEDGSLNPMWTTGSYRCTGATLVESGGKVGPGSYGTYTGPDNYHGPYMYTDCGFDLYDFALSFTFTWGYGLGYIMVQFLDASLSTLGYFYVADWWTGDTRALLYLIDGVVTRINGAGMESITTFGGSNTITFSRGYNNAKLLYNGVQQYNSTFNYNAVRYIRVDFRKHVSYGAVSPLDVRDIHLYAPGLCNGYGFGFKLSDSVPINKVKIFHDPTTLSKISVYTSPNNGNNYVLIDDNITGNLDITTNNSNYYSYFAIDLEKRHDLDIIRNYGIGANKLWLSSTEGVDYSNTSSSDPYLVSWDNSEYEDARWARINLLCGDGAIRCIRKLGIYPNVSTVFCTGGGYNCEWEPLGTILSDYIPSINVAYGATTTGTNNYSLNAYSDYAVDGVFKQYHNMNECWGFEKVDGVDPYLELDFGDTYTIDRVVLYHGLSEDYDYYLNKDYTIGVSSSTSGSFTNVVSVSNNSDYISLHQFTPTEARRLRLTVTNFTTTRTVEFDPENNTYVAFAGSFLREILAYTYVDTGYVDSETWPVVCMNLQDQFEITGHDLVNKDTTDTATDWDSAEEFFMYSDDIFDDPKKVSFADIGEVVVVFNKSADSGNIDKRTGIFEYIFDDEVYLSEGIYNVEWDARNPETSTNISLRILGTSVIDDYSDNIGTGIVHQLGSIYVPFDGFYTVEGKLHEDEYTSTTPEYWGIRNPIIYRAAGLRKWAAVTRNTATDYAYDGDAAKKGIDYLSSFRVYGNEFYNPFEYSWWCYSTNSVLSNDALLVKVGRRSLRIDYPTGSGTDVVSLREGDLLGEDLDFEPKNFLHFWWFIDNVNNIDTEFGNIKFGLVNDADPVYYQWDMASLNLNSGWNEMKLKFEDADYTYPEPPVYNTSSLNRDLDFRYNGILFKSFQITYRGVGSALSMRLDSLSIKRNEFDEDVQFGKGLFLSSRDYLSIPISLTSLEYGTIEFWLKMYYDYQGLDVFEEPQDRVLFTILNNNNDVVSLGFKMTKWISPFIGPARQNAVSFQQDVENVSPFLLPLRGEVIHLAMAWSHDGSKSNNGDTLRLYMNGTLIASSKATWSVGDSKAASVKLAGPTVQGFSDYVNTFWGGGIFENVKLYNHFKTSFSVGAEGIEKDIVYTPNDFLEISQDNVNFYGVASDQLPFVFEQVPAGDSRTVYIRSNKTDKFKQSKSTATLIVEWLSSV